MKFRRVWMFVVVLAVALLSLGVLLYPEAAEPAPVSEMAEGWVFTPASEAGEHPFTPNFGEEVPVQFVEFREQALLAEQEVIEDRISAARSDVDVAWSQDARIDRTKAAVMIGREMDMEVSSAVTPAGTGLFGGTDADACDIDAMLSFFRENPEIASSFADIAHVYEDQLAAYLRRLSSGWLLTDTPVVNHTLRGTQASPFAAVLEAGTAVLVDEAGVPRVRCGCGNPLLALGEREAGGLNGIWRNTLGRDIELFDEGPVVYLRFVRDSIERASTNCSQTRRPLDSRRLVNLFPAIADKNGFVMNWDSWYNSSCQTFYEPTTERFQTLGGDRLRSEWVVRGETFEFNWTRQ